MDIMGTNAGDWCLPANGINSLTKLKWLKTVTTITWSMIICPYKGWRPWHQRRLALTKRRLGISRQLSCQAGAHVMFVVGNLWKKALLTCRQPGLVREAIMARVVPAVSKVGGGVKVLEGCGCGALLTCMASGRSTLC